jgi:endopeptidase La
MDSDISNWLNFINSSKKRKAERMLDKDDITTLAELKLTAIENIKNCVNEMNLNGRLLTNFLSKLELTFTITKNQIKRENDNSQEYIILLLLALCSVMIEVIQDIKLESYEKGRKFNIRKYLDSLTNVLEKKLINKTNYRPKKVIKIDIVQFGKKPNYKDEENDEDEDDDDENSENYEEESEHDSTSDEKEEDEEEDEDDNEDEVVNEDDNDEIIKYTKSGYEMDDFVIDEEEYVSEDDIDYEYEEEDEDPNEDIVNKSTTNKSLNKKFLKEYNKVSENFAGVADDAVKYFCTQDKDVRKKFLEQIKKLNQEVEMKEPILFRLVNLNMEKEQKNHIIRQYFRVMNSMHGNDKLKTWVSEVLKVPFGKYKGLDLTNIKKNDVSKFVKSLEDKMDDAVWGHDEAKRKIVRMMVQKITNPKAKGNVLGIYGVPGNGKTTLIKEGIAKAMDKPFVFISLGGATDASYLEGHSYTYEGSIYGRIIRGIIESKCMNPIIYFDELDKISNTAKGEEIANLLVHLIDPVQNSHFRDKYFHGIDFDLSKVTFIFSFNEYHKVNRILMDRITTVETKYLIPVQKLRIAKNYLLPSIFKEVGLKNNSIKLSDSIICYLIDNYTHEGGVRSLKKILYSICRELNVRNLVDKKIKNKKVSFPFTVKKEYIKDLIKEYYEYEGEKIHDSDAIGIVNGLWANSMGIGGILSIETMLFPSKSILETKATGSLEKVIKESIDVACSLAWSKVDEDNKNSWLEKWKTKPEGFHIHCPDGATPKDGPSAGAALTLAIYSILTQRKINRKVAMTGEINLKGMVTKIGGLENKLQGAKKAGVSLVLIPKGNEKDLIKINKRNSNLLDDNFKVEVVENINQVLEKALI